MNKDSPLYKELVLRSKIMECCRACRHYTIRLEDDYCMKKEAWIYGCECSKKTRYLARFNLSEKDLDWELSLLSSTDEDDDKYDFTKE